MNTYESKTKRKRDRRLRHRPIENWPPGEHHGLRNVSPQNKFFQLELILARCKESVAIAIGGPNVDWDNVVWPEGWSYEKYRFLVDYCSKILNKHRDGRMARIMGGQKQTEAFNRILGEFIGYDDWLSDIIS